MLPWIPPLVGFIISFFTSMGGISGAFLLLPFQISFLNYTNPSVSATNQLYNVIAIPSGVYRYWREGRMVWPLSLIIITGTLPGVFIGAIIRIIYLPDPSHFKLFAALVLLYIAYRMLSDLLIKKQTHGALVISENRFQEIIKGGYINRKPEDKLLYAVKVTCFNLKRVGFTIYDEHFEAPFLAIFLLSFFVGVVGGIYGIGGGAIIAPFLITFFKLPVYIVAGASLMGTFVTSVAGVLFYQAIALSVPGLSVAPDWLIGILFGIGGMAGMYFGARSQKYASAKYIKWMLTFVMLYTSTKYVIDFIASI